MIDGTEKPKIPQKFAKCAARYNEFGSNFLEFCQASVGISKNRIASDNIQKAKSYCILGLQPRDKAAMLVLNTKEIFLQNLHQNRVHFPAERNAFVLDHQHGLRDVTCKPAISLVLTDTSFVVRFRPPRHYYHHSPCLLLFNTL